MAHVINSPAFWAGCGGLVFGLLGLIPAFSTKGNPEARQRAVIELLVGVGAAPLVGEAFTGMVLATIPALAMRPVAMTIGALTVPYGPEFVKLIKREISKRPSGENRSVSTQPPVATLAVAVNAVSSQPPPHSLPSP